MTFDVIDRIVQSRNVGKLNKKTANYWVGRLNVRPGQTCIVTNAKGTIVRQLMVKTDGTPIIGLVKDDKLLSTVSMWYEHISELKATGYAADAEKLETKLKSIVRKNKVASKALRNWSGQEA